MELNTELLKRTWELVAANGDDVPAFFYAHLFFHNPETRDMFPVSMAAQRDKLVAALGAVVSNVDNLEPVIPIIEALGRDHRKFAVRAEHYPQVGKSLLATLAYFSGNAWTDDHAEQWATAYDLVSKTMVAAADAAVTSPPWWEGKVIERERRTHDLAVLRFQVTPELPYAAGQAVYVETALRPRLWRPYSPANAPKTDGTLELQVRSVAGGQVSGALVRELAVGDVVRIGAPFGPMTLAAGEAGRDLLLIGGSTGLAPLRALIDELRDDRLRVGRRVHLFHGARTEEELYDRGALAELSERLPWLTVTMATSDDEFFGGEHGSIGDVAARAGAWFGHEVYVAGPPAMVEATSELMQAQGVPPARIHRDDFTGMWGGG